MNPINPALLVGAIGATGRVLSGLLLKGGKSVDDRIADGSLRSGSELGLYDSEEANDTRLATTHALATDAAAVEQSECW